MECVFCKIVSGEIPAVKIYEDDIALAFLDINPVTVGHTLVIPKKHYSRLVDMPDEEVCKFIVSVKNVAKMIEENLSPDYNIIINQGRRAGQVINHLHFHIIPRYGQEEIYIWKTHKLTENEIKWVIEKLGLFEKK